MAPALTVVFNTYNDAARLKTAVNSVKSIADEIVVVDMGSSDGTVELAKKLGANVYDFKKLDYVEPARNYAVAKATGVWILLLDPDEEVPPLLGKEIKSVVASPSADYYRFARKNIIFNHFMRYARWWPDYNIRLFKKGSVVWSDVIHAVPKASGRGADFAAKEELALIHRNYDSIENYLEKMNRYTGVQAAFKIKNGYKFVWRDLLLQPAGEFLSRYFAEEGYKDGITGLALSLLQGFSELVLYLKIWQHNNFSEEQFALRDVVSEMRERERDLHYWQGDSMFKESGSLKDRVIRKLRV